jgi:Dirigent-like protein
MTTLRLVLAAGAAVALLASGASAAGGPTTLRFLDLSVGETPAFDAGVGEPRPGDRVYLHDALYAWHGTKRGARVGRAEATLTFTSSFGRAGATVEVSGQLFVGGGSIRVDGLVHVSEGPSDFELPVIGGTGRFVGARGVLHVRDLDADGNRSAMAVRLLP